METLAEVKRGVVEEEMHVHFFFRHHAPGLWVVSPEGKVGLVKEDACVVEVVWPSTGERWPVWAQPQDIKHFLARNTSSSQDVLSRQSPTTRRCLTTCSSQ
jgi:hypothetical protein